MSIREVVLDTETTGLSFNNGDKIIEIGCVEIIDKIITGVNFHTYVNTDKIISKAAFAVHGISNDFLKDKPRFNEVAKDLIEFIDNANLIIHNAKFDIGFLNNELSMTQFAKISYSKVIDTLPLAKKLYPGQSVSLDSLCKKFSIDLQARSKHGALIDSELLAMVYIEMTGAKQAQIKFNDSSNDLDVKQRKHKIIDREFKVSKLEKDKHAQLIERLNNSCW